MSAAQSETSSRSPLLMYLVTKNVLGRLEYQDLKSVRFVCKFWSEVAFKILQSKSVVAINNSSTLTKHLNYIESLDGGSGGADADQNDCSPFPNYKIKLPESEWEGLVLFQQFWKFYKSNVKELSLEMPPNFARRILKTLLNDPESELEHLKIRILHFFADRDIESQTTSDSLEKDCAEHCTKLLTFSYMLFTFDGTDFVFPVKWTRFIHSCSRLKELILTGIPPIQLDEIVESIAESRKKYKNSLKIQHLQILSEDISPEAPTNSHLIKLKDLSLPLTELSLEIGPLIEFANLELLLQKCAENLQKLMLRRYPFANDRFAFSASIHLPHLTDLDISDKFVHDLNFLFTQEKNPMPKLQSLKISIRDHRRLVETDIVSNTSIFNHQLQLKQKHSLQKLTIEPLVTVECVRKLVQLFPQLKYLKLRVDDVMARIIFLGLKKLREIYFTAIIHVDNFNMPRNTLTDEGITGIPLDILKTGQVSLETDRLLPHIGALKDLEKITIESWHDYGRGITDFSVWFGLMELKNLQTVKLDRTLISSHGLSLLSTQLNMRNISTTN